MILVVSKCIYFRTKFEVKTWAQSGGPGKCGLARKNLYAIQWQILITKIVWIYMETKQRQQSRTISTNLENIPTCMDSVTRQWRNRKLTMVCDVLVFNTETRETGLL